MIYNNVITCLKKYFFFINYFYKLILKLNLSKKIIDLNIYTKLINKNKFILYKSKFCIPSEANCI